MAYLPHKSEDQLLAEAAGWEIMDEDLPGDGVYAMQGENSAYHRPNTTSRYLTHEGAWAEAATIERTGIIPPRRPLS